MVNKKSPQGSVRLPWLRASGGSQTLQTVEQKDILLCRPVMGKPAGPFQGTWRADHDGDAGVDQPQ